MLATLIPPGGYGGGRNVTLPTPAGPTVPLVDRVALDVLTNPASTEVVRGATLVPKGIRPMDGLTGAWSSWMWTHWPIESFIIPSLDHMAANGCNVVAFKGGQAIWVDKTITWDEYLARWIDTINYAKALGMRVFACFGNAGLYGISDGIDWYDSVTQQTNASLMRDWAQALASTGNVIGIDVLNEVWIWKGPTAAAELARYLAAVKESGIPATYDWYMGGQGHLNPQGAFPASLANEFDFWCFHRYEDCTDSLISDWRNTNSALVGAATKPAFFGEYGAHTGMTTLARQSRYSTMNSLTSTDTTTRGTAAFCWNDFPGDPSGNQFGMHTVNFTYPGPPAFTPRADVVDIWKSWPTSRA